MAYSIVKDRKEMNKVVSMNCIRVLEMGSLDQCHEESIFYLYNNFNIENLIIFLQIQFKSFKLFIYFFYYYFWVASLHV